MSSPLLAAVGVRTAPPLRDRVPSRTSAARRTGGWAAANRVPILAVTAVAALLVAFSYGMNHTSYLIWGAFWVAPALLILAVPVANRAARLDGGSIGRIVLLAALVKIFITPLLRYWVAFDLYDGVADASRYHRAGELLAPLFRQGIYQDLGEISGTRFLEVLTGHVYAVTGPTRLGGFMVFSFMSFIGCYLFYRAFRTACPDGDGRRYALLVFFFPTMAFWPSSIGKEAFMVLALGAAALGAAQLVTGRLRGLAWLAPALCGAAVLRPHMALIVGAGLAVAAPFAVLRPGAQDRGRRRGRLGGAVLMIGLLLAGSTLVGVAEEFFRLESLNTESAQEQLEETMQRTGKGGSQFTPYSPNDPIGFVLSGMTVMFRPFPFEVRNAEAMLTGLEGLVLIALCALSVRRLRRVPLEVFRRPYVAGAVVYVFAFIYAFSAIMNFGILARQRAQLLPMLFVILCIPRKGAPVADPVEGSNASRTA